MFTCDDKTVIFGKTTPNFTMIYFFEIKKTPMFRKICKKIIVNIVVACSHNTKYYFSLFSSDNKIVIPKKSYGKIIPKIALICLFKIIKLLFLKKVIER